MNFSLELAQMGSIVVPNMHNFSKDAEEMFSIYGRSFL